MQYQFSFQGKIQNEEAYKAKLQAALTTENMKEGQLTQAINSGEQSIETENMTIEQYKNLLEVTKEGTPMKRMYDGIKVFQVQGMCGMDMGKMGEFVDSCMQLTGQELLDVSNLLNGNSDGRFSPDQLAAQLTESGHNAAVADGTSITLTREDGSQVKFCDANGDGMLNGSDYDFSAALAKLDADMKAFEANVQAIENEISSHENTVQNLETERDQNVDARDDSIKEQESIEEEIEVTDEKIDDLEKQNKWLPLYRELELADNDSKRTKAYKSLMDQVKKSDIAPDKKLEVLDNISDSRFTSYHYCYGIYEPNDISSALDSWNKEEQEIKQYADSIGVNYKIRKLNNFRGGWST